ncbi:MAG: hypothetical protein ACOX80_04750 [Methanomassiliicoccaceae archaeon]|nr:hypothetical protein [Euryarchaeota archaeon]HOB37951.1 hypothetical protein [Methanomassiliicoccaceae archaeon]HOQ26277.1 hypothetical protein [Methanomassiliicoccaceae archaeon]HQD87663.1 hypothetical protein [Methanomassiliicoccaceae archaeon]
MKNMLILDGGLSLLATLAMLVVGIILLILLVKVVLFIAIPGILALVVWFMTKDPFLTGATFLIIAVLTIIFKR